MANSRRLIKDILGGAKSAVLSLIENAWKCWNIVCGGRIVTQLHMQTEACSVQHKFHLCVYSVSREHIRRVAVTLRWKAGHSWDWWSDLWKRHWNGLRPRGTRIGFHEDWFRHSQLYRQAGLSRLIQQTPTERTWVILAWAREATVYCTVRRWVL
jgi:hypothetical protein